MLVMLCFYENNAWEIMPEDVGFPGAPEPGREGSEEFKELTVPMRIPAFCC